MRQFFAILGASVLLSGCLLPHRECRLGQEWEYIGANPAYREQLLHVVMEDEAFNDPSFYPNREKWFTRNDGVVLLCRRPVGIPHSMCYSDGWYFRESQGQWQATNAWGHICVG